MFSNKAFWSCLDSIKDDNVTRGDSGCYLIWLDISSFLLFFIDTHILFCEHSPEANVVFRELFFMLSYVNFRFFVG